MLVAAAMPSPAPLTYIYSYDMFHLLTGITRPPCALSPALAGFRPGRPDGSKQTLSRRPIFKAQKLCAIVSRSGVEASADSVAVVSLEVPAQPLQFGEQLKAVGEPEALGRWVLDEAPLLQWAEGDDWSLEVALAPGEYPFKARLRGWRSHQLTAHNFPSKL